MSVVVAVGEVVVAESWPADRARGTEVGSHIDESDRHRGWSTGRVPASADTTAARLVDTVPDRAAGTRTPATCSRARQRRIHERWEPPGSRVILPG